MSRWFLLQIDRLWQWIAETLFVRFEFDLPVEAMRPLVESRRLVFVLVEGGILEWLILSSWSRSRGLGAVNVANRMRVLFFSRPGLFFSLLFRWKTYGDLFLSSVPGPRVLYVKARERKSPTVPTTSETVLAELYAKLPPEQREDLVFAPIFLLWRKHTRGSRNLSEYLLGLSSNPNWIGKFWYLLRKRSDSTVRSLGFLHPLAKGTDPNECPDDETEAMRVARSARRKLLVVHSQEMRIMLGPRYHSPWSVKETVLRLPEVQEVIEAEAKRRGVPRSRVVGEAYRNLTEIVGDYRYRFIEVMYVLLTWLFTKVFDGFESKEEDALQVREAMKSKSVIFVPCHRSHLDYLVIPYLLFLRDMVTPYVAAGVNLNFWPVGYFLRQGGAFFIRRSFRGDPVYAVCLRQYIQYLVRNRHNTMFFIEGTRSRNGKMLPPAYGLLKMCLETMHRREVDDIAFVPVSIVYDEVPEQGAYSKELGGAKKEAESARALLKSRKIVRRKFGKVYVRLAKPIPAREFWDRTTEAGADATLALQKLAFEICKDINDVSPVTVKSIVCTLLLTHGEGSLSLDELLRLSQWLAKYVEASGGQLARPLDDTFRLAVEQVLRRLQRTNMLVVGDGVPRTFAAEHRRRVVLNIYKNSAVHIFVLPAMLLLGFFRAYETKKPGTSGKQLLEDAVTKALWLRNLFKWEFFFSPSAVFRETMAQNVKWFFGDLDTNKATAEELVVALGERVSRWDDLSVYLRLLGDLCESYGTAAQFLLESPDAVHDTKQWAQRMLRFGEMRATQSEIAFPESLSLQTYQNTVRFFENETILAKDPTNNELRVPAEARDKIAHIAAEVEALTELLQRKPEATFHPETALRLPTR